MLALLGKVGQEMQRQQDKWGEQNHPSWLLDDVFMICEEHGIELSTDMAKGLCDERLDASVCSWQDILNEEVLEARDEAINDNQEALKEELIQIAAVALSWVQSIERNT